MPTLSLTKTYSNGNVLTEAMLDNIRDGLHTFFNTTKIDSDNIQTGGIATANLANNCVTADKIAAAVAGSGLAGGAGTALSVNVDGTGIEINADTLRLKDSGVTTAKIADAAVTVVKLADSTLKIGEFINLGFSASGDTLTLCASDQSSLSSTNSFKVAMPSTTGGRTTVFTQTSNVSLDIGGAHWGMGGNGNFSDVQLRVFAINDTGSIKYGIGLVGRRYISSTDTTTTASNATSANSVFVNSALNVGTWPCVELGFINADFADAGDTWTISTDVGDLNVGVPVPTQTDAVSYSLTIGATTTAPTKGTTDQDLAIWWRRGDRMHVRYEFSQTGAGASGSGTYTFPLPSGYKIDSTKNYASTNSSHGVVGHGMVRGATNIYIASVLTYDSSNVSLKAADTGAGSGSLSDVGSGFVPLVGATTVYSFEFSVPIVNWGGQLN